MSDTIPFGSGSGMRDRAPPDACLVPAVLKIKERMVPISLRYPHPNRELIAAKVIDGEAIMINLSDGSYYSLTDVGGFVWEQVETGKDLDAIAAAVAERYAVTLDVARADLDVLFDELAAEGIASLADVPAPPGEPIELSVAPAAPLPYRKPELEAYRDMQDLLALDPPGPGLFDANN